MSQSGAGKKRKVAKVLKGVDKYLKEHKLISKGAKVLVKVAPEKYKGKLSAAGDVAKMLGYGVSLPGGSLRLAGQGKKKKGTKKGAKKRGRPKNKLLFLKNVY